MTDSSTVTDSTPGLFARVIGVIVSPSETFKAIVQTPRPVGILFLVCVAMAIGVGAPQMTDAGRRAALTTEVDRMERQSGQPLPQEQRAQLERIAAFIPYLSAGSMFVAIPFLAVLFSALYWAFFNIVLGGNATFGQVLTVNAHSHVITALGALAGAPIQLMQGTFTQAGPFNLGALTTLTGAAGGSALFFESLTFFGLWQAVACGIGIGVLYRRRPLGIIIGLIAIYLGVTALFTVGISSVMGGSR